MNSWLPIPVRHGPVQWVGVFVPSRYVRHGMLVRVGFRRWDSSKQQTGKPKAKLRNMSIAIVRDATAALAMDSL